ncbi:MAG: hypothetical protein M5U34_20540 [Chloroflexi bacterium]|nr:hypothetical protein [Chloroflexota bacterium]
MSLGTTFGETTTTALTETETAVFTPTPTSQPTMIPSATSQPPSATPTTAPTATPTVVPETAVSHLIAPGRTYLRRWLVAGQRMAGLLALHGQRCGRPRRPLRGSGRYATLAQQQQRRKLRLAPIPHHRRRGSNPHLASGQVADRAAVGGQ